MTELTQTPAPAVPAQVQRAVNPFAQGGTSLPSGGNAVAESDTARAIAEVQAALVVARATPRDPIVAMDRILNACTRPSLANAATYVFSRGGTEITGPTIRLAEAIAQSWGNLQYGIRELSQKNGVSTVAAYAWDVETNTRREVVFQVALKRDTKKGSYALKDSRDIYELVANQGARRLRSCILSIIPGDVVEAALSQCEATQRAHVDMSPEALANLVKAFEQFGVTKAQIEKRIQRRLDTILPAQVMKLRDIYRSLRDGMSTPDEWFEPEETATAATPKAAEKGSAGLKDRLRGSVKGTAAPRPAATVPPAPEDVPPAPIPEDGHAAEPIQA